MKIRLWSSVSFTALVTLLTLAGAGKLQAQATDSILVGVVADPSDAVVPNATIIATNRATGVKYTAKTNATGEYRINNIPVGTYDVEASANGMATKKVSGVALDLNRTASVNFKLEVGAVSTTVQVVESSALIDTSTAQLQTSFNSEASLNLPSAGNYLNDTGVLNLSLLAPGVTQSGGMGYGLSLIHI